LHPQKVQRGKTQTIAAPGLKTVFNPAAAGRGPLGSGQRDLFHYIGPGGAKLEQNLVR